MASQQPALRDDLIVSKRAGNDPSYIIKDPQSERFFRVGEPEIYLARQLDGKTTLEDIRLRVEKQFGAPLPTKTLELFVQRLEELGFLKTIRAETTSDKRKRIRGNILYLRFKAFDPDRLFTSLSDRVRWLFTAPFVVFSGILLFAALSVAIAGWGEIRQTFVQLYSLDVLLLTWLVLLIVITLHEFAHGLACKHFGGQVHEMGFMLIFFQPAMYCNVSDAWLFPEKSKRLWVTFSGAYFELFIWSIATLIWRITDPDLRINDLAFIVMITSGFKTFFNLNPLIKLDGYYLLSDYLEIPNLNRRAFGYLATRFKKLIGFNQLERAEITRREARILLIYGLLAIVFSFGLLGWIAFRLSGYLIAHLQATGFFLAVTLWFLIFRYPLQRLKSNTVQWLTRGKGRLHFRRIGRLAATAILLIASLFIIPMELKVSSELIIAPAENADVRPEVEGIIEEVFVDEGDQVAAGDLIVRLSDQNYNFEIEKVTAQIAGARAHLNMLQSGPSREEIDLAKSKVTTAQAKFLHATERLEEAKRILSERIAKARTAVEKATQQLATADREYDRAQELVSERIFSLKQLDDAKSIRDLRQKEMEEAQADLAMLLAEDLAELRNGMLVAQRETQEAQNQLTVLQSGSRPEEIEEAKADISRLVAQNDLLMEQIRLLNVVSPISGVITTEKLREKKGQLVERGALIASVQQLNTMIAEIPVPEKEIADIKLQQVIDVKVLAYPSETFRGHVIAISPKALENQNWDRQKTVVVKAELMNSSGKLKPNMTGHAKIYCGRRSVFEVLTRRIVRYFRIEFWSWW